MMEIDSKAVLEARRRQLQQSLQEVGRFLKRTGLGGAGLSRRRRIWVVPVLAAGVGLALALSVRRLRRSGPVGSWFREG